MFQVTHVLPALGTGGAEIMLEQLLQATDPRKFCHSVVCLADQAGPIQSRLRSTGIQVMSCGMRQGIPDVRGAVRLSRCVAALKPDILHGWMYHGNLASLFASFWLRQRAPVIWSIHNMAESFSSLKWSTSAAILAGGVLSRMARVVTTPSEKAAADHRSRYWYRSTRWEVIPNGFQMDRFVPCPEDRISFRRELGISLDAPVVGMVGRYAPVKDHANFLSAAALIASATPDVRFVLAGRDVTRENAFLMQQVRDRNLENHVYLLGERQDVPRLLNGLDVATLASRSECFPLSIGEAMSCGVPCVCTDVGEAGAMIGDTGLTVPPRDSRALGRAIQSILNLPAPDRRQLGTKARQRIQDRYSLASVARRFEALYQSVLVEQAARPHRPVKDIRYEAQSR